MVKKSVVIVDKGQACKVLAFRTLMVNFEQLAQVIALNESLIEQKFSA